MKKLFLILVMTATAATAMAQSQLSTIRGKTKDGKTIKVEYYQGSVEDVIQSVKYQLVDELQAEVNDLRGRTKTLQGKVDDANKEITRLNNRVKDLEKQQPASNNDAELQKAKADLAAKQTEVNNLNKEIQNLNKRIEELGKNDMSETVNDLRAQLTEKENLNSTLSKQIVNLNVQVSQLQADKDALNEQIKALSGNQNDQVQKLTKQMGEKDAQISQLNAQIAEKQHTIDSLKNKKTVVVNNTTDQEVANLRNQIATKEATITDLNRQLANCGKGLAAKPMATPVIGLEVGFGPAFPGKTVSEPWAKQVKTCFQADVYFGTARLSESFPISVEAGLGFRKFGMAASLNTYSATLNATDADGDSYQAIYAYSDLAESLSLTYFDIPIRLCIGQPAKDRVTAYFKLGLTPSIKVGANFEGSGKYSLKGYYPQWDVTLENVSQLGFGTDMEAYADVEAQVSGFNLWGNVAFGAYVPFKGSPIVLNAGMKLDYPFMGFGSISGADKLPNGNSGLLQKGAVVIPTVEIGLVYTIK